MEPPIKGTANVPAGTEAGNRLRTFRIGNNTKAGERDTWAMVKVLERLRELAS